MRGFPLPIENHAEKTLKTAIFDIETTGLEAVGAGWILCAVIKPYGSSQRKIFRYDQMGCRLGHEIPLLKALLSALNEYEVWVGHNIDRFDWPYIQSRCAVLGIQAPMPNMTYDTLKAFRRTGLKTVQNSFGKPTGRLDHIVDFFGISQMKTPIYPREHWKTVWEQGQERKTAMNHLVEHCVSDVEMNEAILPRLFALDYGATLKRPLHR